MRCLPSLGFAAAAVMGLCGFLLQGPPTSSGVPAPAAAAGFTNNILHVDFSTVNPNTWLAQNVTNCGAAPSVPNQPANWHFNWVSWNGQSPLRCDDLSFVNDGGTQVLRLNLTSAEHNSTGTFATLAWPAPVGGPLSTSWLPNEYYSKIVFRADSASINPGAGGYLIPGFWSSSNAYTNAWFDIDQETSVNGFTPYCNAASFQFYGQIQEDHALDSSGPGFRGSDPLLCSGPNDLSVYNTEEALTTSNESSLVEVCDRYNGVPGSAGTTVPGSGCTSIQLLNGDPPGFAYTLHERSWRISISTTPDNLVTTNDLVLYIKSLDMWTCPNGATQTCPGTIVTTWP